MTPNKDEISRELQELGFPALASQSRGTGFRVPDGYFESFSQLVSERLDKEKRTLIPNRAKVIRFRTTISMAASFLLLVALGVSFLLLRNGKEEGFLADTEDFLYDDYFARTSEMDRELFYDLILNPETADPHELTTAAGSDEDFMLDYLLDAAQYSGIDPIELISQPDIDNQP